MARECTKLGVEEKTTISQEKGKYEREREVAGSKKGKSKDKAIRRGKEVTQEKNKRGGRKFVN